MSGHIDPDTAILASNPEIMTVLAVALELEMLTNASAREAYARIYGRSWSPLASEQTTLECEYFTGNHASCDSCTSVA